MATGLTVEENMHREIPLPGNNGKKGKGSAES